MSVIPMEQKKQPVPVRVVRSTEPVTDLEAWCRRVVQLAAAVVDAEMAAEARQEAA